MNVVALHRLQMRRSFTTPPPYTLLKNGCSIAMQTSNAKILTCHVGRTEQKRNYDPLHFLFMAGKNFFLSSDFCS